MQKLFAFVFALLVITTAQAQTAEKDRPSNASKSERRLPNLTLE